MKKVKVLINGMYILPLISNNLEIQSFGQRSIYLPDNYPTKRVSGLQITISGISEEIDSFLKDKEVFFL